MPKHLTTDDTGDFVTSAQIGEAGGVAQLGPDGLVPDDQLPTVLTGSVTSVNGKIGNVNLVAEDVSAIPVSHRGAPNGVPQLDALGRIPSTQIPLTVVQNSTLGEPGGIATLNSSGKLTPSQVPTAPVTSVNGKTGAVSLSFTDVGALATTQKGAVNGLATLDSSTKVPVAQIPSLTTQYQAAPSVLASKPGMVLTSVAGGAVTSQWAEPMVYTASSSGAMPSGVPNGSLCTRTDQKAVYEYVSGSWIAVVPYEPPWTVLSLPSGMRAYGGSDSWRPRIKRVGNVVWIKGRMESNNGSTIIPSGTAINLPDDCVPPTTIDLTGTSTAAGGQAGVARWQANLSGTLEFFAGGGPNPETPWLGLGFTYRID